MKGKKLSEKNTRETIDKEASTGHIETLWNWKFINFIGPL